MKNKISYLYGLIGGSILILTIILTSCFNSYNESQIKNSSYNLKANSIINYNTDNFIYLSDIPFDKEKSNTNKSTITLDELASGAKITLKFGEEQIEFSKGIYAHATSTVVYNIENLEYDYFETYIGLNTNAKSSDGVRVYIYTSIDGDNWNLISEKEPDIILPLQNAKKIKVPLKGAKYLKLYADDNGNNKDDFLVYANALLTKDNYQKFGLPIKKIKEYDEIIQENYKNKMDLEDYELTILQRNFVENIGYENLEILSNANNDYFNTLSWLMNNKEALSLFLLGGKPDGSYISSIKILSNLYTKNKKDLEDKNYQELYLKMMIALSLTHSKNITSWISKEEKSNPQIRYDIYKSMLNQGKLDISYTGFSVEELKLIMNNTILDEEIEWLHDYIKKQDTKDSKNPKSYIINNNNYKLDSFYNHEEKTKWQKKYYLDNYNITYEINKPRLWMAFEAGANAIDTAELGTNIRASLGEPSILIKELNHQTFMYQEIHENKNIWKIEDDIFGIEKSGFRNSIPLGWGEKSLLKEYNASYIYLIQEVLDNYDKHSNSEKILILANSFQNNTIKENIIEESLKIEPINLNAWYSLINIYLNDTTKTEENTYNLLTEISKNFKEYPLPMYDLLESLKSKFTSSEYKLKFTLLLKDSLEKSSQMTQSEVILAKEINTVANYLLNRINTKIADFSFNDNKITIKNNIFTDNNISWEYSLDNQNSWQKVNSLEHIITKKELDTISDKNDIKIRITNSIYDNESIYTIDIEKSILKNNIYNNDLENTLEGLDNTIEWRYNEEDTWKSYDELPILDGEKTIQIRARAHDNYLPSDITTLKYTKNEEKLNKTYIPLKRLSIIDCSETAIDNSVNNLIDGNIYTDWISKSTSDLPYIILKIDKPIYLSSLDFLPALSIVDNRIKDIAVYTSMNNLDWSLIHNSTLENTEKIKNIDFPISKKALYIKIVALTNYGDITSISGSMINLYEDKTKKILPEVEIEYNLTELTNHDVTAEVKSLDTAITFTNEGGNKHVFKKNGEFTFTYKDEYGNIGQKTAKVNWIDKEPPKANIYYDITEPTNKNVTVHLSEFSKNITILNNTGRTSYTFTDNGEFDFLIRDQAGNESTIHTVVDWIDRTKPNALIEYSTTEDTENPVIATLITKDEDFTIINNKSSNTFKFVENGEFTFIFRDKAGNENSITASVDWIKKSTDDQDACYVDSDKILSDTIEDDKEKNENLITNSKINKTFTIENITLEIPSSVITENTEINIAKKIIDENLKEEVGNQSKSFELYLTEGNTLVDIESNVLTKINLDNNKEFLGIYSVTKNNILKSLDYNTINDNLISIETKGLGKFIISYDEKNNSDIPKKNNFNFYILLVIILIALGITIYRNKNEQQSI